MSEPAQDEDMARVEASANHLAEHYDSVQIFVTRHEAGQSDGTVNIHYGAGNWFTRYGQVREWMIRCDEDCRIGRRDRPQPD